MIRPYEESDYQMICRWWDSHNETPPLPGMMVPRGTFIYEHDGRPILSLTVHVTQSAVGYLEGYISDPECPKDIRNQCALKLWDHCFKWAKLYHVKYLMIYAAHDSLARRYEKLGMIPSNKCLTVLYRTLGE